MQAQTQGQRSLLRFAPRGKSLYDQNCALCHGQDGAGNGPAASFLDPKPRNFTSGIFKFRSTTDLPTDDDLFRTITRGVPGTLMPSFEYLPAEDRWALVAYVKTFSNTFQGQNPKPIPIPEPPPGSPALLATGQKLYATLACLVCHGPEGKGDGPSAAGLLDDWGNPIKPYDFTKPLDMMPDGSTLRDIYRTIECGVGGTPMPSFAGTPPEELWALAYYVRSLAQATPASGSVGNAEIGKQLFVGSQSFANGGPPCISCHSVAGIGALGGGIMGPDLTVAFRKFGSYRIDFILTTVPFPVMRPLFSRHPLRSGEQADVLAFLQSVAVVQRAPGATAKLFLVAAGLTVILLLLPVLFWRRRLRKVRIPMLAKP